MLGDKSLLSKLSASDMITMNAIYHHTCLTRLYRKVEMVRCAMIENLKTQGMGAHVLNKDHRVSGTSLTMVDLMALYDKFLTVLGFLYIKMQYNMP